MTGSQAGPPAQDLHRVAHFRVPARLEEVAALGGAVRAFLAGKTSEEVANAVELGISEAFNNIVLHGQPDTMAEVMCSFADDGTRLVIELEDRGSPIPAAALADAGPQVFEFDENAIASLPEGGMGLALLKMSFDRVSYQSGGGMNRLRLEKHIGPPA